MFYAQEICKLINTFERVLAIWDLIKVAWGKAELASKATPLGAGVTLKRVAACHNTEALHKKLHNPSDGIFTTLNKFCKFANCQQTPDMWKGSEWTNWLGEWQQFGLDALNEIGGDFAFGEGGLKAYTGRDPVQYMNGKDSLVVSLMTACIPGIIHNLDKYRQIQCMYAHCMQTGVGEQGLPVFACEDQKNYATCKYILGEVFQVIPFVAAFNYYANLIKNALSNPFNVIGIAASQYCQHLCNNPSGDDPHQFCIITKIVSMLGATIQDVTRLFEGDAFKIRDDYCKKLEENEKKQEAQQES